MIELLKHMLVYLQKYHSLEDGGVHINLIARIKEKLEELENV